MLTFRKTKKETPPKEDPSSIGNIALELGYITQEELNAAVGVQQQRLPLGRILVDMGKLTETQLEELLFEQRVRRGEINDKGVMAQHERAKLHQKMGEVQAGFRELRDDAKRLSGSLFETSQMVRARAK
jgi:hypothetical protein